MKKEKSIQSMTGFGRCEAKIAPFGTAIVELKSINHKAMETVIHAPEGFSSLEGKIKNSIEEKIKRGRITCSLAFVGSQTKHISINRGLLKEYLSELRNIGRAFDIRGGVGLDTLINLPGVISLSENRVDAQQIWPRLKTLVSIAVGDLVKTRKAEGEALYHYLKSRTDKLEKGVKDVEARFRKAISEKLSKIKIDEERVSFLKDSDITEELERLVFHIKNFKNRLLGAGPIGKELDFIAQEMQREANTTAAKSFDTLISAKVIAIKSEIEKLREQLQNIE
ncbi:MAG: YicC family protein [Candidatus Omnitrophica bacterium]|nr:YicC family protein [Candidatus Omnitrophota bacterium]